MKIRLIVLVIVCITSLWEGLSAQTIFDTFTSNEWNGEGQLMGSSATFKMKWSSVLNDNFYQLNFENRRYDNDKEIQFTAIGLYRVEAQSISGTWFDSRGISFPLVGTVNDSSMVIQWGSPDNEMGKTIYELINTSELKVKDFILKDDNEIQFGTATYQKL